MCHKQYPELTNSAARSNNPRLTHRTQEYQLTCARVTTLGLPLRLPVKQQPTGHTSQPKATTLWPTNSQVLGATTLDLPCHTHMATTRRAHHSTKNHNPMVNHCARCYNTGLTIY